MKNIITYSFITLLFTLSINSASAQATTSLDLLSFNEITLDINANVTIKQGKKQSVEVSGPQELIDLLNKDVKGEKWEIEYTKRNVKNKNSLDIKITLPHLVEVDINGSGDIKGATAFHETEMEIGINGSGSIHLELYVEKLEIGINGSGSVNLNGTAEDLEVGINGSGDINSEELTVETAEFSINGSGDSKIHVTKKLSATINGSGDIKYTGEPDLKLRKNGSGSLKKMEDN